jgi:vacuolar iron transporter family protein
MSRLRLHSENHLIGRMGWSRAAVLGANDGIISTHKLDHWHCRGGRDAAPCHDCGCRGTMAAGEYVSVSSQCDTEHADLAREHKGLNENAEF